MSQCFWTCLQKNLSDLERRKIIGASDAPIIMGQSRWMTRIQLWELKTGRKSPREPSARMLRGIYLEPQAREAFCKLMGKTFTPQLRVHPDHSWMIASLDGMTENGSEIVEIKCPGQKDHELARAGEVPLKYFYQLQHQMAVTGLPYSWYYSWDGQEGVAIEVPGQEESIHNMIEEEKMFLECVRAGVPPGLYGL